MGPGQQSGNIGDIKVTIHPQYKFDRYSGKPYPDSLTFIVNNYGNPIGDGPYRELELFEIDDIFSQAGNIIPALRTKEREYNKRDDAFHVTLNREELGRRAESLITALRSWLEEHEREVERRSGEADAGDNDNELGEDAVLPDDEGVLPEPEDDGIADSSGNGGYAVGGPYLSEVTAYEFHTGNDVNAFKRTCKTVAIILRSALTQWHLTLAPEELCETLAEEIFAQMERLRGRQPRDELINKAITVAAYETMDKDTPPDRLRELIASLQVTLDPETRERMLTVIEEKALRR